MKYGLHIQKGEQTYSLSNKELRAVEVLYADSGIINGMFTVGD